jgi:hypothetical protein
MSNVVLRDGSVVRETTVTEVMGKLQNLYDKDFGAFHDLFQLCKDPNYDPRRVYAGPRRGIQILIEKGLIGQDERVSRVVRNVLLSSVEDSGGAVRLTNPVIRKADDCLDDESTRCLAVYLAVLLGLFLLAAGAEAYYKRVLR